MGEEKLQELYKTEIIFTKAVNFRVAWNESTLCALTDRGIEMFELTSNLFSFTKFLDFSSSFLQSPRASPVADIIPSPCTTKLPFSQEVCIDPTLWGHNPIVEEELAVITTFEWSPPDITFTCRNILAVLTSHGGVSFYSRRNDDWHMLLDLSRLLFIQHNSGKIYNLDNVRRCCAEIQSSSICWISTPNCCWFVTAQRSQKVILWKLTYSDELGELHAENKMEYYPEIGEISTMSYFPRKYEMAAFVFTTFSGTIQVCNCQFKDNNNNISFHGFHYIWPFRDLMVVNHITSFMDGENMVLVCAKNRHLLMFLLNTENNPMAQYVNNGNDYRIIGMTKPFGHNFYIGTCNNEIFNIKVKIYNSSKQCIVAEYIKVPFKEEYSEYTLCDISHSTNKAIWAITATRSPVSRPYKKAVSVIFLKFENYNSLDVLLKNPTEKLTSMLDCVEVLRLQLMKDKRLPNDANLDEIFSNPNLSTYYMKLYLTLWRLYKNTECFQKTDPNSKSVFDTLSPETIRDTLLIRHAIYLIDVLYQLHQENKDWKKFQKDTFLACCNYAKYYCKKYQCDISSYGNCEALKFAVTLKDELCYKCAYCEQHLEGYKCVDGHPNQFCIMSLQPIRVHNYLECKLCGATAHPSLYLEKAMCTFCDAFLKKYF